MKLFIDSCDPHEIREARDMGLIDGVAMNRLSQDKNGKQLAELILQVREAVEGPIFVEISGGSIQELLERGGATAGNDLKVIVQMLFSGDSLKAVKLLNEKGIKTCLTCCFSLSQALLAAKAGAAYISPFLGHTDDLTSQDFSIVKDIRLMYDGYDFDTQILVHEGAAASYVIAAAQAGSDGITVPFPVLKRLLSHPMTEAGARTFLEGWEKVKA